MDRIYIIDDRNRIAKLHPMRAIGTIFWCFFKGFLLFLGACVLLALVL